MTTVPITDRYADARRELYKIECTRHVKVVIVVAAMPMDIGLPSPLREFGADIVGLSMMFVGCVRLRGRKPPERKTSLVVAAS